MDDDRWMDIHSAIDYLGGDLHPETVRGWVRQGKLRAARPTLRLMRFKRAWLDEFMMSE